MGTIRYLPADLERLASLREQFHRAAMVADKLFHATRIVIEPRSEDEPSRGWEEFLADEQVFECLSYERAFNGVRHSCYYGARARLREYTGLAAVGFGLLSLDLCAMLDSHRNATFDRDIWTLALYRIALREEYRLPLDLKGSGPYARTEAQRYPWLRSVVIGRPRNPEREQVNLLGWRAEVAGRTGHAPRYVYASLSLDVFDSSVIAIDYLRRCAATESPIDVLPQPAFPDKDAEVMPRWDKEQGVLYWGREVEKRVASKAKNVIKVLDACEANGWADIVDDPLIEEIDRNGSPGPQRLPDPQKLHSTIKSLNRGLTRMRFHADGTGRRIRWERL